MIATDRRALCGGGRADDDAEGDTTTKIVCLLSLLLVLLKAVPPVLKEVTQRGAPLEGPHPDRREVIDRIGGVEAHEGVDVAGVSRVDGALPEQDDVGGGDLLGHGRQYPGRASGDRDRVRCYSGSWALLGEPVRWSSVKATLAGNLKGPAPRFVRVARGPYSATSSAHTDASHPATGETPASPR